MDEEAASMGVGGSATTATAGAALLRKLIMTGLEVLYLSKINSSLTVSTGVEFSDAL